MKRWHTFAIGLVISIVFLYLSLRQADFAQIAEAFRTARYGYVAATVGGIVLTVFIRGVRWSVLNGGRLSVADGFWLFNVGFLFNNVLPARLGEFARAYLAGRRPQMHFTSALSSIVVERLFDMLLVVIMLATALLVLPLPTWAAQASIVMGALTLLGLVVLAAAARWPERMLALGARVLAIVPRIEQDDAYAFLQPFVEGLSGVSDLKIFALAFVLSVIAWAVSALAAWLLMLAFWRDVPFIAGQLAVAAAGLGVAIPAAPSGVGPYEAAIIGVLQVVGYDANISRGFAFALHAVNFGVTSLLGLAGLMREGVTFAQVAEGAQSLRERKAEDDQTSEVTPV